MGTKTLLLGNSEGPTGGGQEVWFQVMCDEGKDENDLRGGGYK